MLKHVIFYEVEICFCVLGILQKLLATQPDATELHVKGSEISPNTYPAICNIHNEFDVVGLDSKKPRLQAPKNAFMP